MAVIGMDLGGTKLATALFTPDGRRIQREAEELQGRTGHAVGALLADRARLLLEAARAAGDPAEALGVAVPGIHRAASGTVWAPNIPGWEDYPLVRELEDALDGLPIRVDSDRACAVLGESWSGAARGQEDVVFLVVGTGIGAGILSGGRIVRGADDAAGAIGWLALDRPWRAGYEAVGCFEFHASGPGIAGVAGGRLAADPGYRGPLDRARPGDSPSLTARDVFAAYEAGDPIASAVLDEAVAYWGMAVANLVSLLNPDMIVFGGGVFGPATRFLDRIREEAARWAQPVAMARVRLVPSDLGGDAVLHGAGRLAFGAVDAFLPPPVDS